MKTPSTRRSLRPPTRRRGPLLGRVLSTGIWRELLPLVWLAFTALLAISLLSHDPRDPAPLFGSVGGNVRAHNAAGPAGAWIAAAAFQLAGAAAYLLPVLTLLLAWSRLFRRSDPRSGSRLAGSALLLVAGAGLLSLWTGGRGPAGGAVGSVLAGLLVTVFSAAGATVVLLSMFTVAILFTTRLSLAAAAEGLGTASRDLARQIRLNWTRLAEQRRRRRLQRQAVRRHLETEAPVGAPQSGTPLISPSAAAVPGEAGEGEAGTSHPASPQVGARAPASKPSRRPSPQPTAEPEQLAFSDWHGEFVLPPLSLLSPAAAESPVDEQELVEKARLLTAKLQEFGIGGSVLAIHPGPVITTFEFKPEAGVKYSRVTTLVDDLSLALKAESVRIDRLPGRSTIGIEVPNRHRETIRIRELLESEAYRGVRGRLPLALGKTIDGRPYATALERMPHLLIAGATGTGKSVALNAMIASILYHAAPAEVKFIFIDPKMLELGIYEDIPHLICPVVTDPGRAARALKWATAEMTRRYELLFGHGVRNLEQFNRLAASGGDSSSAAAGGAKELRPIPYIIVVIDELADLMMVSSKEVEAAIQRLAQMARAVGIHLIVATQRPSVDVLTGVIKANFSSRIAFRVSSRTDSTVILDQKGAERLLGMGDMLFLPPGSSGLVRIHGALMEEAEALRLVAFLKQQGRPVFNEEVLREDETESISGLPPAPPRDEMFDQAARLVVSMGQASISHLQRRLGLGYARAARLMDSLEAEGIVGPPDGSKPRDVLVPPDYFDPMDRHPA